MIAISGVGIAEVSSARISVVAICRGACADTVLAEISGGTCIAILASFTFVVGDVHAAFSRSTQRLRTLTDLITEQTLFRSAAP